MAKIHLPDITVCAADSAHPRLANLWRHATEDELLSVVREFASPQRATWQYLGLIFNCLDSDRLVLARTLYARAREDRTADEIEGDLANMLTPPVARKTIETLEAQYAGI